MGTQMFLAAEHGGWQVLCREHGVGTGGGPGTDASSSFASVWALKLYGFSVSLYPHIKGKDVG